MSKIDTSMSDENTLGPSSYSEPPGEYSLREGDVLGGHRILKRIGKGGMGEVYLAENTLMRKQVALKLLPKSSIGGSFVDRFRIEARVMADLHHPNIVQVLHAAEENGQYYLTMDYVCSPSGEPQTLEDVLSENGHLPEAEVIEFALQICDALALAHSKELVHRDLKPANMLMDSDGNLKITDFGLAKVLGQDYLRTMMDRSLGDEQTMCDGDTSKGSSGRAILGTYDYMAPEQKAGGEITAQADIYAVGIILYRLLTGEKPEGRFAMPSTFGCADAWDDIIDQCMQNKAKHRPENVNLLRALVQQISSEEASEHVKKPERVERFEEQDPIPQKESSTPDSVREPVSPIKKVERNRPSTRDQIRVSLRIAFVCSLITSLAPIGFLITSVEIDFKWSFAFLLFALLSPAFLSSVMLKRYVVKIKKGG